MCVNRLAPVLMHKVSLKMGNGHALRTIKNPAAPYRTVPAPIFIGVPSVVQLLISAFSVNQHELGIHSTIDSIVCSFVVVLRPSNI